ncbi:MAG TPA: DUF2232 domain-containing protein [Syntrophomonas sp.]|nr:DUF2232 domain-containing protein [Syntrophomonas sp.]
MPVALTPFLISFAACLAMHVWPSGLFLWAIIWGITVMLGAYYMELKQLLAMIAGNVLFLLLLGDNSLTLEMMVFYALPITAAAVLLKAKKSYYAVLGAALLTVVVCTVIYMGVSYVYLGDEGVAQIKSGINATMENSLTWAEQSGFVQFYEQQGISKSEIKTAYAELAHLLWVFTPALLSMQGLFAVLLIIYLSSILFTRMRLPGLERKAFREEIMPWQLSWVVIAGLACWLLGCDQLNWLYYGGANLLVVLLPVTIFYGFAVLAYWLRRLPANIKIWIVALLVILGLFFTVPAIIFIGLTGLFDSLLDYRKLRGKKEGVQ